MEQNKIFINFINIKKMLVDNFTKALEKLEFKNYSIRLEITLKKKNIIAIIEN